MDGLDDNDLIKVLVIMEDQVDISQMDKSLRLDRATLAGDQRDPGVRLGFTG